MSHFFKKKNEQSTKPNRVVILGSSGFIASTCINAFKKLGIQYLSLSRREVDLLADQSIDQLKNIFTSTDTLLFISAEAPVKNQQMLVNNIQMCKVVYSALKDKIVNHIVYISSDAVYSDSTQPLNENSVTLPESLHGIMHLTRELMLQDAFKDILCIARPTLIYGKNDPHNGYGPNLFMRKALDNQDILLFGKGEEKRDHVYINDVANIILEIILFQCIGKINLATGKLYSFFEIANIAISLTNSKSKIMFKERISPMPHNGFRPFDIELTNEMFKDFKYKDLNHGIKDFLIT